MCGEEESPDPGGVDRADAERHDPTGKQTPGTPARTTGRARVTILGAGGLPVYHKAVAFPVGSVTIANVAGRLA